MELPGTTSPTPLRRALDTIARLRAQLDRQRRCHSLAVVGVGLRFPGGDGASGDLAGGPIDSLDAYWQAIADGRDLVRAMPESRRARFAADWDRLPHSGGFLDDVLGFDGGFFGISPREARALDPQHRLLLEVAWEALENAALPPDQLDRARAGLYVGITGQDYRDWLSEAPDAYWATGNGHCFAAGRLAYAMGFMGPAIAVDTACSSGLVAVHLAGQALRSGECDIAVAGGVNLILSPRSTRLVQETRALALDGRCKPFDARANGFTRGEGCGVVVLKRLDQALRDGDRIHAVIRGSAVNQDGRSSGFTAPNVRAQIALVEAALADAGLSPADIGLVEAHGTGTSLGDPIEMDALVAALGRRNGGATLHVGSVKANIGHLEAAAGVAGLIKAIACCARRAIPPLVHFRTLNPRIDLAGTGITMPTTLVPWTAAGRFAAVSSFGLSGTNAHVIVGPAEPAEPPEPEDAAARPALPVTGFELTARTPEALRTLAARLRARLAALPGDDYDAFAYTASFGRARHAVRAQVAAADRAAAMSALDALATGTPCPAVTFDADAPRAALARRVVELPHYPWQREHHAVARTEHSLEMASPIARSRSAADDPVGCVRDHAAAILGHRDARAVPVDGDLFALGLDSLMAADLASALSKAFERDVSIAQVFEQSTVTGLAAAIGATVSRTRAPRIAFLFSAQGGHHAGMGRALYESEPVFRARIDACDRILAPQLGGSIADVMLHGKPDALEDTRIAQPAQVALQLALVDLWRSWGVTPSVVIGHSLGEVAAAIHAGVMDVESGLALVVHRARLMQSTAPGAMLALIAPLARAMEWIAGTDLDVAAINGPQSVVVAGARREIDALGARLAAQGVSARPVAVSLASHSRLMEPILGALHDAIAGLAFHPPRVPIIANLTGRLAVPGDHDARYWCRHVREPVRFHDAARQLAALDVDVCLEIGPGGALVQLVAAAGLLPAGGGVTSLQRGTDDRVSMLSAARRLGARVPSDPAVARDPQLAREPAVPPVRAASGCVRPRPLACPSLRLIVFHHAGGSAAMYRAMSAGLPADWELLALELPGRGTRHAEDPISDMSVLAARVLEDLRPWLDVPFALFGHSLGGILAAEIGRACEQLGRPPVWVGISGRVAPTIAMPTSQLAQLDDESLLAKVIALGGMLDGVADHRETRERFLRMLRADLALLENYQAAADRAMLGCPVTAFAGINDEWAPPTTMRPWARETRGRFRLCLFPGGHFYFRGPGLPALTRDIVLEIDQAGSLSDRSA